MSKNKAFIKACGLLGGSEKTAELLGISASSVSAYRIGARRFPVELAPKVQELTGGRITIIELLYS